MVAQESVLVMLVRLVDRIPLPPPAPTRPRGRPRKKNRAALLEEAADGLAVDPEADHAALSVDLLDRVRRHEAAAAGKKA